MFNYDCLKNIGIQNNLLSDKLSPNSPLRNLFIYETILRQYYNMSEGQTYCCHYMFKDMIYTTFLLEAFSMLALEANNYEVPSKTIIHDFLETDYDLECSRINYAKVHTAHKVRTSPSIENAINTFLANIVSSNPAIVKMCQDNAGSKNSFLVSSSELPELLLYYEFCDGRIFKNRDGILTAALLKNAFLPACSLVLI